MGCCAKTSQPRRGPGKPSSGNRAFWKLREKESEGLEESGKQREGGGGGGGGWKVADNSGLCRRMVLWSLPLGCLRWLVDSAQCTGGLQGCEIFHLAVCHSRPPRVTLPHTRPEVHTEALLERTGRVFVCLLLLKKSPIHIPILNIFHTWIS